MSTKAPALEGRFSCDSEGGMFCAYSSDRPALQELADLMSTVATDADQIRNLIASATAGDFEFDD